MPLHPRSIGSAIANVHGHTHTQPDYEPIVTIDKKTQKVSYKPYINISLERTNYRPLSFDEVMERINKAKGEYEDSKVGEEATKSLIRKVKND